MKRCPECRRDYYDDTLSFCLDDGNALLDGPASADEPATAILSEPGAVATGFRPDEAQTRPHIIATDQTAILRTKAEAEPQGQSGGLSERPSLSANRAAEPQGKFGGRNRLLLALGIAVMLLVGGFFGYRYFSNATGAEQINSIAVLPFENRSGNADTDYLSDGLADSLIYRLSQLPNLKVSPTSSVMRYKGKGSDTSQIAKDLNVDAVMSGRLVQIGDSLNISVQLTDGRTDKLIWAEQYDRKMADLLATQREIATAIIEKLQLKLAGDEKGITKKYTNSNEAYQLYLKGRHHFAKRTKNDIQQSIDYYRQAIGLDPNFALAYARIAEAYNQMPVYPYMSPNDAIPQAKVAAKTALEIDPFLSEAHTAMANSLVIYDWNWPEAEREFKRAIELDPNSSAAHLRYGLMNLSSAGRFDEAAAEIKRALEIEPLDVVAGISLSYSYFLAGQYDLALEQAKKAHNLEPNMVLGRWNLGRAYIGKNMYAEAIALSEQTLQNTPDAQLMMIIAGHSYAKTDRRHEAERMIERLNEIGRTQYAVRYHIASIYATLGETDKAFVELERSFEEHDWFLHQLKVDPVFAHLRNDPRFKELLKRMGLAP